MSTPISLRVVCDFDLPFNTLPSLLLRFVRSLNSGSYRRRAFLYARLYLFAHSWHLLSSPSLYHLFFGYSETFFSILHRLQTFLSFVSLVSNTEYFCLSSFVLIF